MNKQGFSLNKKILISIIIIIFISIIIIMISNQKKPENNLINPEVVNIEVTQTPPPAGGPAPKTFQFDASTDLEKELESIDPKVLDSDLNE